MLPIPAAEAGVPQYHLAPYVLHAIAAISSTFNLQCLEREINAGLSYACSSDLWSLGLLILWMLDRSRVRLPRTPRIALTWLDLTKSVRQELISNLDPVRIDCKGELGALISQLLEKVSAWRAVWIGPNLPESLQCRFPRDGSKREAFATTLS